MRYLILAGLLFVFILPVCAQFTTGAGPAKITGTVRGVVTDRSSGKAISGVSIMAKTTKSVLIAYTFTDEKGAYVLSKLPPETEFKLYSILYGYQSDTSAVQKIRFPESVNITRNLALSADLKLLDEVKIEARKPPFIIRKDTLEFDATAFKLLPHAILEDLLRRLNGVQINQDGGITVNGKKATKIQLDGRDFFGNNMSIATQNLSADIIDKIQVTPAENLAGKFDKMFKPVADDVTINVLLKKNSNTGFIGNLGAGYGSRERYTGNGFLSTLGGKIRYGFSGSAGNGNSGIGGMSMIPAGSSGMTGFSAGGGAGMLSVAGSLGAANIGGGGSSGGIGALAGVASGGLQDHKNVSGTFNTDLSKKLKIDGNYSYGYQKSITEKLTERFNFQDSEESVYNANQSGWNINNTHSYHANIQFTPDSLSSWRFMPGLNYSPYQKEENEQASNIGADGAKINSSDNVGHSEGTRKGFRHGLFFGTRSGNGKAAFTLNWNISADQHHELLNNRSSNEFFKGAVNGGQTNTNQKGTTNENSLNNHVAVRLSRSLGSSFTTAIEYQLNQQSSRKIKDVFNLDPQSHQYTDRDIQQSGNNKSNNLEQTAFFQLAYRKERLNVALNMGMKLIIQQNRLLLQDTIIRNKQRQFAPRLMFNYSFENNSSVNLNYDISSNTPSPEQLSPIADSSNPLVVLIGNPFLKTALGHNINAGFYKFIPQKEMSMNLSGTASFIKNQIVQDVNYDDQGRQVQSFRNVDGYGALRLSGSVQKGFHVKELGIQPSLNFSLNKTNDVGYINSKRNETRQWQYGGNIGVSLNYREFVSLSSSANLSFNQTDYSLDEREDLKYNTQNYSLNLKVSPVSRIELGSQLSHQYNSQIPVAFKRSATVLNSSVTYRFLKKEQLSFKVLLNDVFNNAIATSTVVTPSFRENTSLNVLRRYVLFSLQYNFSSLSGQFKSLNNRYN